MEEFLGKKAADCESEALKSLVPGFIIQPRYRSLVGFGFPLEMRMVTLWGKARLGVWWWGRNADPKGRRTTWMVRVPKTPGKISRDDTWEALHEHTGGNRGFDVALGIFRDTMPGMAAASEAIATAVGAPFLRSDFFVGSPKWGTRLNEVAYGSGLDYKRRVSFPSDGVSSGQIVDDGPAVAQILQEGFPICQRKPPAYFLRLLGAKNAVYEAPAKAVSSSTKPSGKPAEPHMRIESVPPSRRQRKLSETVVEELTVSKGLSVLESSPLGAASCETQAAPDPPSFTTVKSFAGYPSSSRMCGYTRARSPPPVLLNSFASGPSPLVMRSAPLPGGHPLVPSLSFPAPPRVTVTTSARAIPASPPVTSYSQVQPMVVPTVAVTTMAPRSYRHSMPSYAIPTIKSHVIVAS